jgi:hypothetical protein
MVVLLGPHATSLLFLYLLSTNLGREYFSVESRLLILSGGVKGDLSSNMPLVMPPELVCVAFARADLSIERNFLVYYPA